jgi:L-threonylcarbamoyladenylate synthase
MLPKFVSNQNETKRIYEASGTVLVISSANKTGQPEATTLDQALGYFGNEIELYIDSGEERGNKGTTQLDIRGDQIKVMRDSPMFPVEKINQVLRENGIELVIS